MSNQSHNDPLHGMKLQTILEELVEHFGWKTLSKRIEIRCFYNDPSIKSSLKFLRSTPWAREQVEKLYLTMLHIKATTRKRDKRWYDEQ